MSGGDCPALPPGVSFCPPASDLTDVYLRSKIIGEVLPGVASRFIHVADVYSAVPEKLVSPFDDGKGNDQTEWYFFSPVRYAGGRKTSARGGPGRKSRTIDGEAGKHWHSEHAARPVKGGSKFEGYEQNFSYMVKNASTGKDERAGWIMTEYGISPEHGGGDLVLCKIHRSPRTEASTPSSAAVPVTDPIVGSKKRKAADGDHFEDPIPTASARPRRTDDHDEQLMMARTLPMPVESLGLDLTSVNAAEPHRQTGDEFIFDEDPMAVRYYIPAGFFDHRPAPTCNFVPNMEQDFWSSDPNGTACFADHQPADQAAQPQPSNFFDSLEGDIWSLDQICGLVAPAPTCAAQLENEAAGLVQAITADANGNDKDQMDASLREEPETTADGSIYYRSLLPAFSACLDQVIRRCNAMAMF